MTAHHLHPPSPPPPPSRVHLDSYYRALSHRPKASRLTPASAWSPPPALFSSLAASPILPQRSRPIFSQTDAIPTNIVGPCAPSCTLKTRESRFILLVSVQRRAEQVLFQDELCQRRSRQYRTLGCATNSATRCLVKDRPSENGSRLAAPLPLSLRPVSSLRSLLCLCLISGPCLKQAPCPPRSAWVSLPLSFLPQTISTLTDSQSTSFFSFFSFSFFVFSFVLSLCLSYCHKSGLENGHLLIFLLHSPYRRNILLGSVRLS